MSKKWENKRTFYLNDEEYAEFKEKHKEYFVKRQICDMIQDLSFEELQRYFIIREDVRVSGLAEQVKGRMKEVNIFIRITDYINENF